MKIAFSIWNWIEMSTRHYALSISERIHLFIREFFINHFEFEEQFSCDVIWERAVVGGQGLHLLLAWGWKSI